MDDAMTTFGRVVLTEGVREAAGHALCLQAALVRIARGRAMMGLPERPSLMAMADVARGMVDDLAEMEAELSGDDA